MVHTFVPFLGFPRKNKKTPDPPVMVRHHALHGEIYADPESGFSFCSATWRISTMILRVDFIILNDKRKCKFLKHFPVHRMCQVIVCKIYRWKISTL